MMLDHVIPKPASIKSYAAHRLIAELCDGERYQFVDRGDHFIVRTAKSVTHRGKPIAIPSQGAVVAFEMRASVEQRVKGENVYPPLKDWRTRRDWLEKKGEKHGFQVLAVHVTAAQLNVENKEQRRFWIDSTDFTGILKVTDVSAFSEAIHTGIGRVGKAFGMGMLVL